MFSVIRDGTFLHSARNSLLRLPFCFVFRQIFPRAQTFSGGHSWVCCTSVVCPHIWKRCGARCIILGFKQLSWHSYTTSEWGAAVSRPNRNFPTWESWMASSKLIIIFVFLFFVRLRGVSVAPCLSLKPLHILAFYEYFKKLECWLCPDGERERESRTHKSRVHKLALIITEMAAGLFSLVMEAHHKKVEFPILQRGQPQLLAMNPSAHKHTHPHTHKFIYCLLWNCFCFYLTPFTQHFPPLNYVNKWCTKSQKNSNTAVLHFFN